MEKHSPHRRITRLLLLVVGVLSAFSLTAISQPKFDCWYETDKTAFLFPAETRIAELLQKAKNYRKASLETSFLRTVGRIVESSPGDTRVLSSATKLLTEYGSKSDCELAVALTTDYRVWNSPEASVFSDRSAAKSCLRDHLGAFQDLTRALEIAPENFDLTHKRLLPLYSIEPTQTALALYRIAIEDYERAIARNPITVFRYKNVLSNAYIGRAEAHRKLGDKAARLADLTRAIESSAFKSSPYYLDRSKASREDKMYSEAIADMNSYIKYLSETRRLGAGDYVHRAILFIEAGRYADAIADYLFAIERAPLNKDTYLLRIEELKRKLP